MEGHESQVEVIPKWFIDTGKVINEVRNRPLLWDPSDPCHKAREARSKAWREICRVVIPDFANLSSEHKRYADKAVQQRWKTARDAYNRYNLSIKKRRPLTAKKYSYYNKLSFLQIRDQNGDEDVPSPIILSRSSYSDPPSPENPSSTESQPQSPPPEPTSPVEEDTKDFLVNIELPGPSQIEKVRNRNPPRRKITKTRRQEKKVVRKVVKLKDEPKDSHKQLNKDDDNMLFFKSLMPIIDQFSIQQKLLFRSQVLNVAMEIVNSCDDSQYLIDDKSLISTSAAANPLSASEDSD